MIGNLGIETILPPALTVRFVVECSIVVVVVDRCSNDWLMSVVDVIVLDE